jgi:Zn-finger nucleic acid-binding protein
MHPMVVAGETLDISSAGVWFDSGELIAVLHRQPTGFITSLVEQFRDGAVKQVEKQISKDVKIKAAKDQLAKLYNNLLSHNANTQVLNKRITFLEERYVHGTDIASTSTQTLHQVLLCPENRQPMNKKIVDGIEVDYSEFGIWFDGGELQKILSTRPSILSRFAGIFNKGPTGQIGTLEGSVDEEAKRKQNAAEIIRKLEENRSQLEALGNQINVLNQDPYGNQVPIKDLTVKLEALKREREQLEAQRNRI